MTSHLRDGVGSLTVDPSQSYDYRLEKVKVVTRVPLGNIVSIQKGSITFPVPTADILQTVCRYVDPQARIFSLPCKMLVEMCGRITDSWCFTDP